MTYLTAQPSLSDSWDDICYPVKPVWLADILPDYEIMATDRQQLVVGEPFGERKTIFGIQSADYSIIPNILIREVIDKLYAEYSLQIKYTSTGEFSISIILPHELTIGGESLQRSLILTNSYNGKTPFSIQGQTLTTILDGSSGHAGSMYRALCQNGLMGWADSFSALTDYQEWLQQGAHETKRKRAGKTASISTLLKKEPSLRKIHQSSLAPEMFQEQLYNLLAGLNQQQPTLTARVYEQFQQKTVFRADDEIFKTLPIPVQLAKQAKERLRFEQRILGADSSYWLMYNAVNHALFNARSSLTLNDRYKLDEKVFHQLAASALTHQN